MKARILLFEDNDVLRTTLKRLLTDFGYDVHAYSHPGLCPQHFAPKHDCLLDDLCSDIVISDVHMPVENGLDFLRNRLNSGWNIKFRALMSADWTESDLQAAEKIGCRIFHKPFDLRELLEWLENCQKRIDQNKPRAD